MPKPSFPKTIVATLKIYVSEKPKFTEVEINFLYASETLSQGRRRSTYSASRVVSEINCLSHTFSHCGIS